jgi:tetratricopeptide (TPR) repeat protein
MASVEDNPGDAARLLDAFAKNRQDGLARVLTGRLPPVTRSHPLVKKREAALLRSASDWKGLEHLTSEPGWGIDESLRFAFRAEALQALGRKEEAVAARAETLRVASQSPVTLFRLLDELTRWPGWEREVEALLEGLAKTPVFADDALTALFALYHHRGSARDLERVAARLEKLHPRQPVHALNHAALMLLNGDQPARAWRKSEDLLKQHPQHPLAMANAAFALSQQGKHAEALELFGGIPETLRKRDPFRFYEGLLLAKSGDLQQAASAWQGMEASQLLDAERALFENFQKSHTGNATHPK